jgi:glycosyltransferase involved in cell wall biosynthesis
MPASALSPDRYLQPRSRRAGASRSATAPNPFGAFDASPARNGSPGRSSVVQKENERLHRKLAQLKAEMRIVKSRQEWFESELAAQRHARQILEAVLSGTYIETVARIREIVRRSVPRNAVVLVVSKGDGDLVELGSCEGRHFPQDEHGAYAGYYPADSTAAIEHLHCLVDEGAQYLLLPNVAFWWLEHYRAFAEHLEQLHERIWQDDCCLIYRLRRATLSTANGTSRPERSLPVSGEHTLRDTAQALPNILCFPIIDWDYRFQRPQQLMRQFAAAGHRVFYLTHAFRKSGESHLLRPLAPNLNEVSLRGSRFKVRHGVLDEESRRELISSLAGLRRDCLGGATVAIVQSAFWWPVAKAAALEFNWPVVYDCMDLYSGFPGSHALLLDQERDLMIRADLVVASSPQLKAVAEAYNSDVLLVRNACDYAHFASAPPGSRGERPIIGYYGAIAEWFDSSLVAELAKRRPDWDFVLIGSTVSADLGPLSGLSNVSLPGEKPYGEIPAWLGRFDVAILPFKRTPLTEAVNPVKAYEIFAAGRPLVSVPLPEMRALVPLVRLASTAHDFEREIEQELFRPDAGLEAGRRRFARANTWESRMAALAPAVGGLISRTPTPGPCRPTAGLASAASSHVERTQLTPHER